MREETKRIAAGVLSLAAAMGPSVSQAASALSASPASDELVPAVMHFKVDYTEAQDAPPQIGAYVDRLLKDVGEPLAMWSSHPCHTISGSGNGWDDSDCW